MSKNTITTQLLSIKNNGGGHITFIFEDGTKQRQPINKQVFFDEKGKSLNLYKVVQKFNDMTWDLKAKSFEIN